MKIERLIEQAREELITDIVLSDEFMNRMQENFLPIERLMSYYRCAIMEVETKFRVLNEQFSLQYDRNPIETIKTRVKSFDGILKKVKRKQIPFSLESIEENINDIAGVRVVCSFPEDIYLLAECLLQQDDIRLIEKKRLHQESKTKRLPESAPDRGSTDLFRKREETDEGGSTASHYCNGLLGKFGA